ncbi:DinB family protein [Flavobacteriaceae bacterium 3-367]
MKPLEDNIAEEFVQQALYRMDESSRMIKISLERLTEADMWRRPNKASNSIGNLMLHLCGNITQYAIASLGGTEDTREREKEFSVASGQTKAQLWAKLEGTVQQAQEVIKKTSGEALLRKREVQGFSLSGIGIIIHVVEHYSYHTGQIAFWTKLLKEQDLGFYDGMDLDVKNE